MGISSRPSIMGPLISFSTVCTTKAHSVLCLVHLRPPCKVFLQPLPCLALPFSRLFLFRFYKRTLRVKKVDYATVFLVITSSDVDRFLKFFHWHTFREIWSAAIIKYPTHCNCLVTLPRESIRKLACPVHCGSLAERSTLQSPDVWQAATAILR